MNEYLFVGGYKHGQSMQLWNELPYINIPIPPKATIIASLEDPLVFKDIEQDKYKRDEYRFPDGRILPIYVLDSLERNYTTGKLVLEAEDIYHENERRRQREEAEKRKQEYYANNMTVNRKCSGVDCGKTYDDKGTWSLNKGKLYCPKCNGNEVDPGALWREAKKGWNYRG